MKEIEVTIYGRTSDSTSSEKITVKVEKDFRTFGSTESIYEELATIIKKNYSDKIDKLRFKEFKVTDCKEKF